MRKPKPYMLKVVRLKTYGSRKDADSLKEMMQDEDQLAQNDISTVVELRNLASQLESNNTSE